MPLKKKAAKQDEVVQAGQFKISAKFVISILAALGLTGGGLSMKGDLDRIKQAEIDIATIKNDVQWIKTELAKKNLTADVQPDPGYQPEP